MLGDVGEAGRVGVGERLMRAASTKAKIAMLAPMPSESMRIAVMVKPGLRRSWRREKRMSCRRVSRKGIVRPSRWACLVCSTPPSFRRASRRACSGDMPVRRLSSMCNCRWLESSSEKSCSCRCLGTIPMILRNQARIRFMTDPPRVRESERGWPWSGASCVFRCVTDVGRCE